MDPVEHPTADAEALLQEQLAKELEDLGGSGATVAEASGRAGVGAAPATSSLALVAVPLQDLQSSSSSQPPSNEVVASLESWWVAFLAGLKALQTRDANNQANPSPGGKWPYELSLVATFASEAPNVDHHATASPSTAGTGTTAAGAKTKSTQLCSAYNDSVGHPVVLLVAWQDTEPTKMLGRVVDIKDGKIVALVPARHAVTDFRGSEVILNTIGARPHREGKKTRPDLPPLAALCLKMWETAIARLHAGPHESVTIEPCVHCNRHSDANLADGEGGEIENVEPVFTCAVCLMPCHMSCTAKLKDASDSFLDLSTLRPDGNQMFMPERFSRLGKAGHNAVCRLCGHMDSLCS